MTSEALKLVIASQQKYIIDCTNSALEHEEKTRLAWEEVGRAKARLDQLNDELRELN